MKYNLELKLECIHKYLSKKRIQEPEGVRRKTFMNKVYLWVRLYKAHGIKGLNSKNFEVSDNRILELCHLIDDGMSMTEAAIQVGRDESYISNIYHKYCKNNGVIIKSHIVKGAEYMSKHRIENQVKEKIKSNGKCSKYTEEEIEYILAENAYLKKLKALTQEKNQKQQRK